MIKLLLPFVGIFLIYNFVHPIAGIAALVLFLGVYVYLKYPEFYMLRGNSKYNKGEREKGLALMYKAYKTGKLNSNMTVYYSYCLVRENKVSSAFEILDEYLASGKGKPEEICRAKHNKAIMLRNIGKIEEAFELMKEVHKERSATDTYGTLGLLYVDMAKIKPEMQEEAVKFLKEAYDYNSDDRTIADNLGEMYLLTKDLESAAEIYEKIVAAKPQSPTAYYHYGCVLMEQGNMEDAEEMFNRALRFPFTGVTAIKRSDVEEALKKIGDNI